MKLTSRALAVIVPAVFIIGIGGTAALNLWQTESDKIPNRIAGGEFEGEYDPSDIRGSYSFADIENAFGVSATTVAQVFGFASGADAAAIRAKDLEDVYEDVEGKEIGTDSLRYFVALWKGIPYEPKDTTALPYPAIETLRDAGKIDAEELSRLRAKVGLDPALSVGTVGVRMDDDGATERATEHDEDPEDTTVKGRTTFNEVLSWGLTGEQIETAIGVEMGPRAMTIRDYVAEKGMEFKTAREKLQSLLDKQ